MNTLSKILDTVIEQSLTWSEQFIELLPRLMVSIVVMVIFAILAGLMRKLVRALFIKVSDNESLNRLSQTMTYIAIMTIGLFIALSILQLEKTVTSLRAGVGVVGLALGFAFQETAANFMSGILLAIKRPYRIGDVVRVGDAFGKIKELDLRTTVIESWTGQDMIIPNKDLYQGRITNFSTNKKRRIDLLVGISYADDLDKAAQVTKEAAEKVEYRLEEEDVNVWFTEFGTSSINLIVQIWIPYTHTNAPYYETLDAAVRNIRAAYKEHGITIPFPIRTLDFGIKGGENLEAMLSDRKK